MKYYLCVQCTDKNGDIRTFIRDENRQQISDSYQDLYELFSTPYWRNNWMSEMVCKIRLCGMVEDRDERADAKKHRGRNRES